MAELEKKDEKISGEAAQEIFVAIMERQVKRLFILCLVIFSALVISNAAWIFYENTYQDVVVTENTQDGEGINILGGGDVNYGAETKDSQNKGKEEW